MRPNLSRRTRRKGFSCDIERHAPDLIGRVGDELANGSLPWAVTPDELTDALRRAGTLRNGRVVDVTADALRTTVLSRVGRLHLTYEGATDGAPSSVFIKTGQLERTEQRWQGYRHEVDFYTDVAPKMPSGVVPTCLDAQFDEATGNWRLVLEDLTDTHGLLKTPWPLPPSIEESKLLLSTWAGFHAAWWDSPLLGGSIGRWADPSNAQIQTFTEKFEQFEKELGERLSPERRDVYRRLIENGHRLNARYHSHRNMTIVHGDSHPWNVLLPLRDGDTARIFDWDCWRADVATDDVAYMMAVHWFPDYRRRNERAMLDHYHDELLRHGVTGYGRDALWDDYRLSTLWHIATPVWQCVGKIPPAIWWNHLDRIFSAVEDLDCRTLL